MAFKKGLLCVMSALVSTANFHASDENVRSDIAGPRIWSKDELYKTPKSQSANLPEASGVKSLFYEGLKYKGAPTKTYAYYGAPEGEAPPGGWPAIVLVHGGGGTAYPQYVKWWNRQGYAAISMDLEGHLPGADDGKGAHRTFAEGGPCRSGMYEDIDKPLEEQWFYHCVAQVVLAHSLIRSFPEVNPGKTGVIGVSWGGVVACVVVGVDDRFRFAVPVYGCAALVGSDGTFGMKGRGEEQLRRHAEFWEGSAYLARSKVPMLWINGTNDINFPLDSWQKSTDIGKGPHKQRAEIRMPHGHDGFMSREAVAFADEMVKNTAVLPEIGRMSRANGKAWVEVMGNREIVKAELCHTVYGGRRSDRRWESVPAAVSGTTVSAVPPENATAFYFNITNERGLMLSSEYVETGVKGKLLPSSVETGSFDKWVLVDLSQRKDAGKYLAVAGKTVSLMAGDRAVQYLHMPFFSVENGWRAEFSFTAEGAGKGHAGFFAYKDESWAQTEGDVLECFEAGPEQKSYEFSIPVKGDKVKAIRVFVGAEPRSKVNISNLKISARQ